MDHIGAANIIYRFSSSSPSKNLLLRLRKALPSGSPNIVTYQYLESTIFPLLPKDLPISYRLVKIPPTLIERLNTALTDLEATGKRPKKRHGLYLTLAEPYGFLITDMTPEEDTDEYLIEFKPKWLTQSPSAPKDWKRCRTCALRLKKAAEASEHISTSPTTIATLPSTTHHKKPSWNGYCPLDLSSSSPDRLRKAVSCILSTSKLSRPGDVDRVTEYLHSQGWLRLLKSKQNQLDTIGPLAITEETASHEFLTCMTLRDCTVFLKVNNQIICSSSSLNDIGREEDYTWKWNKRKSERERERKIKTTTDIITQYKHIDITNHHHRTYRRPRSQVCIWWKSTILARFRARID